MSVIHHFNGTALAWNWEAAIDYPKIPNSDRAKGESGKIIIGPPDGATHFVFRYFRVEPGGYTVLHDVHAHDHGVLILHGRARVHLGDSQAEAGPRDVIYIAPHEAHWLEAVGDEPLGFLCVIPNKEMLKKLAE